MMRLASRWQSRLGWLGLFAMLLALAGPVISQTQRLLSVHSDSPPAQMRHGAGPAMAHHGHAPAPEEHSLAVGYDLAECGYCLLFLNMPGITPSTAVTGDRITGPQPVSIPKVPAFSSTQHPRFLPRAPPGTA